MTKEDSAQTENVAIDILRRRLGALLSWAAAHETDAQRLRKDAADSLARAAEARRDVETVKAAIVALGGIPEPTELSHGLSS